MEFDDERSNPDEDNIEDILEDLTINDDINSSSFVKRDNTIFVVDCSPEMMETLPGEKESQFGKIMDSYANFLMSKVISSCSDRVGLIFYNVNKKANSLNFEGICTVHELETPSAKVIKSVAKLKNDFSLLYGHSDNKVSLHQVLWLYGQEIKDCEAYKNFLRMFLFTANDCPHEEGDERRDQAINHARQLAAKSVHIELFPVLSRRNSKFDVRKFYQEIICFDTEDLNPNTLDSSSKIMDLQTRIRQKQFKKRTLNRLQMQIGPDAFVGMKIYALYSKARKPQCKKLEASSNRPLKRIVKRLNAQGDVLFNEQIGTYYPLGGERVRLTKEDLIKIKSLKPPGISLIGFKPKRLIKPFYNLRASYFLYPDEDQITGSTQFTDALIDELLANSESLNYSSTT